MKILPFNFFLQQSSISTSICNSLTFKLLVLNIYFIKKKPQKINLDTCMNIYIYIQNLPPTPQSPTNHALLPLESDGQSLLQFLQGLFDQTLTAAVKHPLCKPANKKNQGIKIKFHFQSSQFQVRYANKYLQQLNRSQGIM